MAKRILALVLCVLCLPLSVFAASDNAVSVGASRIEFVKALGIVSESYFTDTTKVMNRGELASLIVDFMEYDNLASSYSGAQVFFDVEPSDSFYGSVCVATQAGICSGHLNGLFEPYEEATVLDAVTMILNAIGLKDLCKQAGYPAGYIDFANSLGITNGLQSMLYANLTNEMAIKCLYNTLFSPYTKVNHGQIIEIDSSAVTYAYKNYGIVRARGVVTATPYARIGDSVTSSHKIEIDGVLYPNPDRYGEELIGQRVEFYYKENQVDGDTIIYISPDDDNITIAFSSDNANYSLNNKSYTYYEDNGTKERIVKLSALTQFIVNGVPVDTLTEALADPADGFITVIDNNNDGVYDYVNIESYETMIVGTINTEDKYINDNISGKSYDYSKIDEESIIILDAEGNEISFDEIGVFDVLTLAKSQDVLRIYRSSKVIEDTPGTITNHSGYSEVEFAYGTYITADYYDNYSDLKINLGEKAKFYYDYLDRIVYLAKSVSSAEDVAFILGGAVKRGLAANYEIKYIDASGNCVVSKLAKNVKIDGIKCTNAEEIKSKLCIGGNVINELVSLKKNDSDEIISIETAYSLADNGSIVNQITNETKADGLYVSYKTDGSISYQNTQTFLGYGPFYKDALIMIIDVDEKNNIKTDSLARHIVTTSTYMKKYSKYNAKTYKFSKNDPAASIVVLFENSDNIAIGETNSTIALVNRVSQTLEEDMTVVHEIDCIVNGANKTFKTVNDKIAAGLSTGDLIRYSQDPATTRIISVELTFDESRRTVGNAGGSYASNYRSIYMPVYSVNGEYLTVAVEEDLPDIVSGDLLETYQIASNSYVFKYDSKEKEFRRITISDIKDYKHNPDSYEKIYICTAAGAAKVFVVYE